MGQPPEPPRRTPPRGPAPRAYALRCPFPQRLPVLQRQPPLRGRDGAAKHAEHGSCLWARCAIAQATVRWGSPDPGGVEGSPADRLRAGRSQLSSC